MATTPLRHMRSGKVRDLYDAGPEHLLLVASDRLSAYDVIMDDPVPDKGRVLTALSTFWFEQTAAVFPNHHVSSDPADFPAGAGTDVAGRAMLVRRATVVPLECVVRGYLFGSAWKDYSHTGHVQGVALPSGLREADRLPQPIFTPTTKAEAGHDMPLTPSEAAALVGRERYDALGGRGTCALSLWRRPCLRAGRHHRRHEVRARRGRRSPRGGRRGAHARLVAVLARRRMGAGYCAALV